MTTGKKPLIIRITITHLDKHNNEVSTSESSILEDPQLPISPTNIRLGPLNKENKKNVQFRTPEND